MKTMVRLMGIPGSGKSTVGKKLADVLPKAKHYSFGALLKHLTTKESGSDYDVDAKARVYEFLKEKLKSADTLVLDTNPYPPDSLTAREELDSCFDRVFYVELSCSKKTALERMNARNRGLLDHEGNSSNRIENWYVHVRPSIDLIKLDKNIVNISTQDKSIDVVVKEVLIGISFGYAE